MPAQQTLDPGTGEELLYASVSPQLQNINYTGSPLVLIEQISVNSNADNFSFYIAITNSMQQWLLGNGNPNGTINSNNGIIGLSLEDLDTLPNGNYTATIYFQFNKSGQNSLNHEATVNLNVNNTSSSIKTEKNNYNVVYNRQTNVLSGETHVEILNNTAPETLSLQTIGTLFNEVSFTTAFDLVEDAAYPFSSNTELPTNGEKVVSCRLKDSAGNFLQNFTVTITVVDSDDIFLNPINFNFSVFSGETEQTGILKITNPVGKNYTITKPSWLSLSANSGNTSANITVTTNTTGLSAGNYTGNIVVSYDSTSKTVPVSLKVLQFVSVNSQSENFCQDDIFFNINQKNSSGRFVKVLLEMIFENSNGVKTIVSSFTLPYFQNKATLDIGRKIEPFFPVFENFTEVENDLIYKAATVKVIVEELDVNYNSLSSVTINDLKFFPGKRPLLFPLFTNFQKRSFNTDFKIYSKLSGNEVRTTFETTGVSLFPIPETHKHIKAVFLNQNLAPEWFSFAYKHQYPVEFEHIADDFEEKSQKYNSREKEKFTVNTGWILPEETKLLKELVKSKIVWLKVDNELLKTYCITSKIIQKDSETGFVNFDLEFKIIK